MGPGSVWCHREHMGYQLWSPRLFLDWWLCTGFGYLFVVLWNSQNLHLSQLWQSSGLIMLFFSRSECPERQQINALWSWWPANLVTLTQATNLCITSPYNIPIPLLVILPPPRNRTFPCSNSEENRKRDFLPPFSQRPVLDLLHGLHDLSFQLLAGLRGAGCVLRTLTIPQAFLSCQSHPLTQQGATLGIPQVAEATLLTQALLAAAPHCTTTICKGQTLPGAHSWQVKSNPCTPEGRALASDTSSVMLWRAFTEDFNVTFMLHDIKVTLGI